MFRLFAHTPGEFWECLWAPMKSEDPQGLGQVLRLNK